jgi:hypothetical protein
VQPGATFGPETTKSKPGATKPKPAAMKSKPDATKSKFGARNPNARSFHESRFINALPDGFGRRDVVRPQESLAPADF